MQGINLNVNIASQQKNNYGNARGSNAIFSTFLNNEVGNKGVNEQSLKSENMDVMSLLTSLFNELKEAFPEQSLEQINKLKEMLSKGDIQGIATPFLQLLSMIEPFRTIENNQEDILSSSGVTIQGFKGQNEIANDLETKLKVIQQILTQLEQLETVSEKDRKLQSQMTFIQQLLQKIKDENKSIDTNKTQVQAIDFISKQPQIQLEDKGFLSNSVENKDKGTQLDSVLNKPINPQMNVNEQRFILNVNSNNGKVDEATFVKDLAKVLETSQYSPASAQKKLLIRLFPEKLGYIRVELIQKNDGIVARIFASTEGAKKLLQNQLGEMKSLFNSNITIEKIETHATQLQQERSMWKQGEQKDQQQQQQQKKQNKNKLTAFIDELLSIEV